MIKEYILINERPVLIHRALFSACEQNRVLTKSRKLVRAHDSSLSNCRHSAGRTPPVVLATCSRGNVKTFTPAKWPTPSLLLRESFGGVLCAKKMSTKWKITSFWLGFSSSQLSAATVRILFGEFWLRCVVPSVDRSGFCIVCLRDPSSARSGFADSRLQYTSRRPENTTLIINLSFRWHFEESYYPATICVYYIIKYRNRYEPPSWSFDRYKKINETFCASAYKLLIILHTVHEQY